MSEPRPRVLVVDDTPDIRALLKLTFQLEGYEVVGEAGDGAEAVELAEVLQPDLVTLDLAMPVMDGLQALPRIKAVSPGSRIVVLSGFAASRVEPEVRRRGADAYLEKGAPLDEVVRALHRLVPEQRAPAEAVAAERHPAGEENRFADVVREVNGSVTVIEGFARTLRTNVHRLDEDEVRHIADRIVDGARRLRSLVRTLTQARKVETGELGLAVGRTDLAALVIDTVAELRPVLGDHTVVIGAPTRVPADLDPVRVADVVVNLCLNAARYSPVGTTISVTVEEAGGWAYVRVHDDGPGVPRDAAEAIFEPFQQLGGGGVPGTGLGLYVARGIARAHGGDVRLVESPAGGATFELRLRAAEVSELRHDEATGPAQGNHHRPHG